MNRFYVWMFDYFTSYTTCEEKFELNPIQNSIRWQAFLVTITTTNNQNTFWFGMGTERQKRNHFLIRKLILLSALNYTVQNQCFAMRLTENRFFFIKKLVKKKLHCICYQSLCKALIIKSVPTHMIMLSSDFKPHYLSYHYLCRLFNKFYFKSLSTIIWWTQKFQKIFRTCRPTIFQFIFCRQLAIFLMKLIFTQITDWPMSKKGKRNYLKIPLDASFWKLCFFFINNLRIKELDILKIRSFLVQEFLYSQWEALSWPHFLTKIYN